ncbi:DUF4270 family protein [Lutibacter sp.]|uniref:DUF4270 family protein n=1 Tax=Lutibacter sp. TaxID=1925666 RepID=UPI0025C53BB2|nr:DUF4270 family protein [Lutibacter sp.]MCF6167647.1 DUF4270 domain-containing protein [Lutibacter sp.]
MKYSFILFSLSLIAFVSCNEDLKTYPVGEDFIDNNVIVTVIDTFSLKCGTFMLDSVVTSNTGRILLGSVIDNNLGQTTSQSYLKLKNTLFDIDTNAKYDSIGFVLNYDTYYYGDTTVAQTYKVHRVRKIIEPDEGLNLYNTSNFLYDNEVLGELTFTPMPNRTSDSLYIPLNFNLGKEIFDKLKDNEINNFDDFEQFFNGITIIPNTTTNSNILGFQYKNYTSSNNSSMRIYYTISDDDNEGNDSFIDFNVVSEDQFNHIESNRLNTQLDNFETSETIISSSYTNNIIYTQGGTGISARVEIPYLENLKKLSENGTVLDGKLLFYPLKGSYDNNQLEESLTVYVVDHKNRVIKELGEAVLTSNKYDEFNEDTYYTVDLTLYIEEILSATYTLNYALMFQFSDYKKTVDKILIEDDKVDEFKMKLQVSYLTY